MINYNKKTITRSAQLSKYIKVLDNSFFIRMFLTFLLDQKLTKEQAEYVTLVKDWLITGKEIKKEPKFRLAKLAYLQELVRGYNLDKRRSNLNYYVSEYIFRADNKQQYINIAKTFMANTTYKNQEWNNFIND